MLEVKAKHSERKEKNLTLQDIIEKNIKGYLSIANYAKNKTIITAEFNVKN